MSGLIPSNNSLQWILAAMAILFAAIGGYYIGVNQQQRHAEADASIAGVGAEANEKKYLEEIAELRTQRDISDASNRQLQETLQQLQVQNQVAESAQGLYERIEGVDVSTGLAVDTVSRVEDANGRVTEFQITLIQARGRDRVSGKIGVALIGEKDDSNWREVLVQAENEAAPQFDMRFFQTMVVPVPENDILVDIVEIEVIPRGNRHKRFKHEIVWSAIQKE